MKNILSFKELQDKSEKEKLKIKEIFEKLESFELEREISFLRNIMKEHLLNMQKSIQNGLKSTTPSLSGLSGGDAVKLAKRYSSVDKLPLGTFYGKILTYSIAITEENQRMGRIVACPTAGSCGIVPSVIVAYSEELGIDEEKQIDSLFVAGGIGKLIAQQVPLAGAVAGCQAECGAAAAMAAGALVELMGGNTSQIINAAALALKNCLGLACDPVGGLVEVPCIKRNAFYATHSITASEMALAGIKSAIPMDEIIQAMMQIGHLMSPILKESSDGGLATTKTGLKIAKNIQKQGFETIQ